MQLWPGGDRLTPLRMTKPVLPPCSVDGCIDAAGVIVDGAVLCPHHGIDALERLRTLQRARGTGKSRNGE